MVDRLLDRLQDCSRKFRTAAVIGGAGDRASTLPPRRAVHVAVDTETGAQHRCLKTRTQSDVRTGTFPVFTFRTCPLLTGEHVLRRLPAVEAGVEEVLLLDSSAGMLDRARRQQVMRRALRATMRQCAPQQLCPRASQAVHACKIHACEH